MTSAVESDALKSRAAVALAAGWSSRSSAVEQVPGAELWPEPRERIRLRDRVEAQIPAPGKHCAALARLKWECMLELSQ